MFDPLFLDVAVLGSGSIYRSSRTGIHRYVSELTKGLSTQSEIDLHLISTGRGGWLDLATREAIRRDHPAALSRYRPWSGVGARLLTPFSRLVLNLKDLGLLTETVSAGTLRTASKLQQTPPRINGLFHSPAHAIPNLPSGVKRILTVHDMIPFRHPGWCRRPESFRQILASIDPNRDRILCVSDSTKADFLESFPMDPARVSVTPLAPASHFTPVPLPARSAILHKHSLEKPYLLSVATLEPRKNLDGLLRAFKAIATSESAREHDLVLIGVKGWMMQSLEAQLQMLGPIRKRVRFMGYVADADLPSIYSGCTAFLFPSLYEGFGLPPIEAMACGAPAVCLAVSSLPEVIGDAVPLVKETSTDALAQGILDAMALPKDLLGHEASRKQASRFTWERTVSLTVKAYKEHLG